MPRMVRSGFRQLWFRLLRAGWLRRGSWRWRAAEEELDDQVPVAETEAELAVEPARDEHLSPYIVARRAVGGLCRSGN